MPETASSPSAPSKAKRGALTGAALSDEVFDSSPSLLRPTRGNQAVAGLQQFFAPPEVARLIAGVNGRRLSTLDLTAGNGALLAGVDESLRFGVEIDADQVTAGAYEAIHGDVQRAYPLLRLLGTQFPRIACNPPFGLDWSLGGKHENSTVATWRMAAALLDGYGAGAFVAGRDRFAREVMSRDDAAGIYALVECEDLFEGVQLPCVIAFFVRADNAAEPRSGGPLSLTAAREELTGLAEEIRAEREQVANYVVDYPSCPYRDSLIERFETVRDELARRRESEAAQRQRYDLALKGRRVSARPSPFARLALREHRVLRNVERLHNQPTTYFALNLREWRELCSLAEEEALTLDPALCEAVKAAITEAERAVCPLYEVRPQQRLAFLDDLDQIHCIASDPERGFEAGKRYPLETASAVQVTESERAHHKRNGDVEIRKYENEAKVLRVEIDGHRFNESASDVEYLLEHFELPDPGDLGTRYPDEVEAARAVLRDLAERHDFETDAGELAADEEGRKPGGSWRVVPFVAPLRTILREEWIAQGRPKKGKVCPPRKKSRSGMVSLDSLQTRAHRRWRELDLEPIALHEARHTAATWLDHAGVSPKVASQIMGHKTPEYQPGAARITLERYTHMLPGELERARHQLDEFLAERSAEALDSVRGR